MAAPSKAQLLNDVLALLKKRYKLGARETRLSVLEAVIYGICHEGNTRAQADEALARFKSEFFDWNELRVSTRDEIRVVLQGVDDSEERAFKIRRFLRQLFEKTYGFNLDALGKKPLKESTKSLQEFEAFKSDYVLATVIHLALGGHAIPVDVPIRRALQRLGLTDSQTDIESLRGSLERAIPKTRGTEFVDLMEELAHDTCVAGEPDCQRCELRKICPTGQAKLVADKAAAKAGTKVPKVAVPPPPPEPAPAKKPMAATTRPPLPAKKPMSAPAATRPAAVKPAPAPASKATPTKPGQTPDKKKSPKGR